MTTDTINPLSWDRDLAVLSMQAKVLVECHLDWVDGYGTQNRANDAERAFQLTRHRVMASGDDHVDLVAATLLGWVRVAKAFDLFKESKRSKRGEKAKHLIAAEKESALAFRVLFDAQPDADITIDVKHVAELMSSVRALAELGYHEEEPIHVVAAANRNTEQWTAATSEKLKQIAFRFEDPEWGGMW